jgi:hypothetical protein
MASSDLAGHTWGKVVCKREVRDAHQMLVFSTGRGCDNNAAKQLEKVIRRCHHTHARTSDDGVERAGRLLDGANTLLDAADSLLTATDKRAQPDELLSLAEQALTRAQDSEAFLDAASELDSQSSDAQRRATELAVSARYSPSGPSPSQPSPMKPNAAWIRPRPSPLSTPASSVPATFASGWTGFGPGCDPCSQSVGDRQQCGYAGRRRWPCAPTSRRSTSRSW